MQQALQQQSASNIPDAPSIGGIAAPHTATPHQHSSYGNRIRSSTLGRAAKRERYTNLHIRAGTTLTIESEHTSAIIYGSFTIATTQAFLQVLLLPTLTTPFTPGLLYEYMGHSVRKTFIYERVRASGLSPPHSSTPESVLCVWHAHTCPLCVPNTLLWAPRRLPRSQEEIACPSPPPSPENVHRAQLC